MLETGSSCIELQLADQYYRSLIRGLEARGDVLAQHNLTLRAYHLPTPPTMIEHKGQTRVCYKGNHYTLAVLEPDTLLNITDLNQAEYCPRQHLLNRLTPSTTSTAAIRGNLVHYCFKELLKEHDRGKHHPHQTSKEQEPLAVLQRHLEQALHLYSIEMACANISSDAIRADVLPHLESLADWYESERASLWDMPSDSMIEQAEQKQRSHSSQVRAETFLLAPEIGLRGRLDLFWQQADRQRLLELKTGSARGDLPKSDHRWQVHGYHALLTVRHNSQMKRALATLLYSATPGRAEAFGIPSSIRETQRVNEMRNTLVLSYVTNIPPAPPGAARCTRCSMLTQCQRVSSLLQWQAPQPDDNAYQHTHRTETRSHTITIDDGEQKFFLKYYHLLQMEGRAGEQQQALLWKTPVVERIARGTAISGLILLSEPVLDKDGWEQIFRCANTSELREGDEILLSNGDPVAGEVVTGTLLKASSEQVSIWTRELIAHPTLIDRYENDLVHVRTLQNLLRWLRAEPHLRDLVAGKIRPRFLKEHVTGRSNFNAEQNLAVERALQMQDYLLIHGPPGTGKTSVIAEIVKRLTQQGQRVMLAAFTNQAVDNMLKRLDWEGFHDYLRLGHERSVEASIAPRLLQTLLGSSPDPVTVRAVLHDTPVVASTTATWSSDKYAPQLLDSKANTSEDNSFFFDVAIIDEAGQLTIPAILGALRFTRRFILVGDEKQLPPLVLNKEAAEYGLADSLFSFLKRLDDNYAQKHPMSVNACIALYTQYRMNKWISHFSSTVFYNKQLLAHASVANRRLIFKASNGFNYAEDSLARAINPLFPLVFLDVRGGLDEGYTDDEMRYSESKISNAEALAVQRIVTELLRQGIEQKDIGIIAPYRAQVANIRRHLFSNQLLSSDSSLSIDTVDRFQGGERMVIILSFATTAEPVPESTRRAFLVNPNRLNVALTRAQCKMILVGYTPALERLPIFSRLITYCRSMNTLISYKGA
jgi:DNA replication ATP-dependent helicase Dna2